MCYHASIHSPRCCHKFFVVELLFQSFNEIMSLSFNRVYDLIDAIHLFYQNQFPYWSFEKLILHFDFENNLMCIQKLYF